MLAKTAEYALRIAASLGGKSEITKSADELAEHTKVPRRYLNRVLQSLVKAGLVHSRSGPGGGYCLARNSETITILEIVNAVSPMERIRKCPLGIPSHTSLCPLHKELDKTYAATEEAFSRITIGEILRSAGKIIPLGITERK